MARFNFSSFDDLMLDIGQIAELPTEIVDAMINAEADIALEAQRAEARQIGMYSGYDSYQNAREQYNRLTRQLVNFLPGQTKSYSTGQLARSLKKSKVKEDKDGHRTVHVYFAGSRKRGKKRIKNSEIAFLNEYGTRTINARRFVWVANEKSADAATAAAMKIYDEWLESHNL